MFRARWAALAVSAGLLVTSTGCIGERFAMQNRSDCSCMETYGTPGVGVGVTGMEGPVMAPPTFPTVPSAPPTMTAPPPRIIPVPANPQPYAPTKFYRD
jgi:hypothetical protein